MKEWSQALLKLEAYFRRIATFTTEGALPIALCTNHNRATSAITPKIEVILDLEPGGLSHQDAGIDQCFLRRTDILASASGASLSGNPSSRVSKWDCEPILPGPPRLAQTLVAALG